MKNSTAIKLALFALGALALVVGDYLYGTTFYTNTPAEDPSRFLISGLLGYFATVCYIYGLRGYTEGYIQAKSPLKVLTELGLSIFSVGVAVNHSLAAAYLYALNTRLTTPNQAALEQVFQEIDSMYEICFIPMMLGLVLGYCSLFIAILRNKTVFAKTALFFFPLWIALIITGLDSSLEGYPILLKSAAWSGVIFNVALIVLTKKEQVPEQH